MLYLLCRFPLDRDGVSSASGLVVWYAMFVTCELFHTSGVSRFVGMENADGKRRHNMIAT